MRKLGIFVSLSWLSVLHSSRRIYTVLNSASFLLFFWAVERPPFSDIITRFARAISEVPLQFLSSSIPTSSHRKTWHLKHPFAPQDIQLSYSWDRCQVFKNLEGRKIISLENKLQDYHSSNCIFPVHIFCIFIYLCIYKTIRLYEVSGNLKMAWWSRWGLFIPGSFWPSTPCFSSDIRMDQIFQPHQVEYRPLQNIRGASIMATVPLVQFVKRTACVCLTISELSRIPRISNNIFASVPVSMHVWKNSEWMNGTFVDRFQLLNPLIQPWMDMDASCGMNENAKKLFRVMWRSGWKAASDGFSESIQYNMGNSGWPCVMNHVSPIDIVPQEHTVSDEPNLPLHLKSQVLPSWEDDSIVASSQYCPVMVKISRVVLSW